MSTTPKLAAEQRELQSLEADAPLYAWLPFDDAERRRFTDRIGVLRGEPR